MIWQPLVWCGWHSQHPGVALAYLLFIRRVKQWMKHWAPRQWNNQLVTFIFLQGAASYTPGLHMSESLLLHCKVFINDLSMSYGCFLAKPQQGCSRIVWKVPIISAMLVGRWLFLITELCHNSDNQESLPSLFWLPDWGPGQGLGPMCVLQYVCRKPLKLSRKRLWMPFALPLV
jgi:hypothetical protein